MPLFRCVRQHILDTFWDSVFPFQILSGDLSLAVRVQLPAAGPAPEQAIDVGAKMANFPGKVNRMNPIHTFPSDTYISNQIRSKQTRPCTDIHHRPSG
jgi:hypothetical protein